MRSSNNNMVLIGGVIAVVALVVAGLFLVSGNGRGSSDLVGTNWQLSAITEQTPTFQGVVPAAEQPNYAITFADNGTYTGRADCNAISGTYTDRTQQRDHDRGRRVDAHRLSRRLLWAVVRARDHDGDDLRHRERRPHAQRRPGRDDRPSSPAAGPRSSPRRPRRRRRPRRPRPPLLRAPHQSPDADADAGPHGIPDARADAGPHADRGADGAAERPAHGEADRDACADPGPHPGSDARADAGAYAGAHARAHPGTDPCADAGARR